MDTNSLSFIRFECTPYGSGELFSDFRNFYKLKSEESNFSGGTNSSEGFNYLVPSFVFQFKKLVKNTFLRHLKLLQMKKGVPKFWGEPIVKIVWIVWSALLYFNFESFKNQNSSSFIIYQCILFESGVPFSCFSNFFKLKMGDLISWKGTNFEDSLNYLVPPSVTQFKIFEGPKFFIIQYISMHSVWFKRVAVTHL